MHAYHSWLTMYFTQTLLCQTWIDITLKPPWQTISPKLTVTVHYTHVTHDKPFHQWQTIKPVPSRINHVQPNPFNRDEPFHPWHPWQNISSTHQWQTFSPMPPHDQRLGPFNHDKPFEHATHNKPLYFMTNHQIIATMRNHCNHAPSQTISSITPMKKHCPHAS